MRNPIALFALVIALLMIAYDARPAVSNLPEPLDKSLPAAIAKRSAQVEMNLLAQTDCQLLVQVFHPKDPKVSQLGMCLYPLSITQGIFAATSCVGVFIEPDSGVRNPFYGSKGHWGIEGKCEAGAIQKKVQDPSIDKTVNPVSSLRMKRQEGMKLRLLRDDLGVWKSFEAKIVSPGN